MRGVKVLRLTARERRKALGVCTVCKGPADYGVNCQRCTLTLRAQRYGMTYDQLVDMIVAQNGRCKVCRTRFSGVEGEESNVDHCHQTGRVRGILCGSCNKAIGLFKDSPERCRAAADYLEATSSRPSCSSYTGPDSPTSSSTVQ